MITPAMRAQGEAWGLSLPEEGWDALARYGEEVLRFNEKTNITGAKNAEDLFRRHLLDSFAPLRALDREPKTILDVGCGGGFVGVCLKIALPNTRVVLLESVYRKVGFLNLAAAKLGLRGLQARHGRAVADTGEWEPLGSGGAQGPAQKPEPFDLVTARALAPLPQARRLTEPFTAPGGTTMIFQSDPVEGGFAYRLPGETKDRHLALYRKETA